MRRRSLISPGILPWLLAALLMPAIAPADSDAAATLIGSARLWEQKNRPDLARAALEKLLAAEPDHPAALHMLGMLELQSSHIDAAKGILKKMQSSHPAHPLTTQLEEAVRVETTDRLRMAKARFLAKGSNLDEAAEAMRSVFPNGPPHGALGVEYWRVIGRTDQGWASARAGLEQLSRETPDDPAPQFALANLLARHGETRLAAHRHYAELAARIDIDQTRLREAWRENVYALGGSQPLRDFLQAFPDDAEAQARLAAPTPTEAVRHTAAAEHEPASHIDPQANARIAAQHFTDARYAEAAELYRENARQEPANPLWPEKAREAQLQALLKEGRKARDTGNLAMAEQKTLQALEQQADHPAALVQLADIRLAQQQPREAEALYRRALEVAPAHAPAFSALLDLLAAAGRRTDAIALAESGLARQPALADSLRTRLAGWLRDAADAETAAQRPGRAVELLERALRYRPDSAWVRFDLARQYLRLGLPDFGRAVMREGVRVAPDAADMRYAQAMILSSLDALEEALQALAAVPENARSPAMLALEDDLGTRIALRDADDLRRQGRPVEALAALHDTLQSRPEEPRLLKAQARLLAETRDLPAAAAAYRKLIALNAANLDARFALAEVQKRQGDRNAAQQTLNEAAASTPPDRLPDLAEAWGDIGDIPRGLALLRPLAEAPDAPTGLELRYAGLLERARMDDTLAPLLEQIAARPTLSPAETESMHEFSGRLAVRQAERQRAAGDLGGAIRTVETALATQPGSARMRSELAELLVAQGQYARAEKLYRALLAESPSDHDTRLDLAKLLRLRGDKTASRKELDRVAAEAPADDVGDRLALVRQYLALDDTQAASNVVDELRQSHGADPDVLVHAGRVAKAQRTFDTAMSLFQQGRAQEPQEEHAERSSAEREIAALNAQRRYQVEFGQDGETKPGDPGISHLETLEWPAKISIPLDYDKHVFVHVDHVALDAGELNLANFALASDYGSIRAHGLVADTSIAQRATGTMLGVGIETDDWRADIGTTPPEFLVHSIVGGVRKSGRIGQLDYTFYLDRRAVTSSLVSYAGARDPASGAIWGGVTQTGPTLRVARDIGPVSISAQAGAYHLVGKHVLDNNELAFRGAIEWTIYETPRQRTNLGLTLTHWKYDENLRYYTYGQGGYYSPQYYRAISVPVSWDYRLDRFSLQLRGSRSLTRSQEKTMPLYPLDPALQAGQPFYAGGSGKGRGYTLGASAEYEVAKDIVIGARYQKDRSEFYTPDFLNFYLRYTFDGKDAQATGVLPEDAGVAYPPSAIKPYSAY